MAKPRGSRDGPQWKSIAFVRDRSLYHVGQKPIFPLFLTFSGQLLHVLVDTGSGTDTAARRPCLILDIIPVSVLLQAEERRTAEKRRSDSDRGPESEHRQKVSGVLCPFGGILVLEQKTSQMHIPNSKSCLSPKGSSRVL